MRLLCALRSIPSRPLWGNRWSGSIVLAALCAGILEPLSRRGGRGYGEDEAEFDIDFEEDEVVSANTDSGYSGNGSESGIVGGGGAVRGGKMPFR
jgi:hypothetical protein